MSEREESEPKLETAIPNKDASLTAAEFEAEMKRLQRKLRREERRYERQLGRIAAERLLLDQAFAGVVRLDLRAGFGMGNMYNSGVEIDRKTKKGPAKILQFPGLHPDKGTPPDHPAC